MDVPSQPPEGTIALLFTDIEGSTRLATALGSAWAGVLADHHALVGGAIAAERGFVDGTEGDAFFATFHDTAAAARAAVAALRALRAHDWPQGVGELGVRMGLHVGHVERRATGYVGVEVHRAARVAAAAHGGQLLVSGAARGLVGEAVVLEPLGVHRLKDFPKPEELFCAVVDGRGAQAFPAPRTQESDARPPDGLPLPRMLAAYADEPLVGRDREVGLLREATVAKVGRRAALVLGEPGIGKTRHAAAAASEAHAQGAVVALARCPPEASVPFEPWVRAIGELAQADGPGWRGALARAAGPELSALVPELSAHVTVSEQAGASELVAAEGARYRLLSGIGAALGYAAGEAPLHVVLDDAHWCDSASAQALAHLLDSSPSEQLVLIVTAREREMGRGHPVSRVLSDLRRTRSLSELRLEGLDAGGLAALVAARVGRAITPRLAARLLTRTSGNPFFAGELARGLDERGALREGEALDAAPVPDAVTDLVEERLARLSPNTQRLLVAVAAIGPSAPVSLAARGAGISEQDAERAVTEALSERLVDKVAAKRPTIAFPHALIREALSASSDEATGAELHLKIAEALQEDPEAEPAELARHYGVAVAVAGPERAIAAYQAAALAAAEGHDHEQAAGQLRSALALLPESDLTARAPLLLELGEQELLAADLPRAREAFRAAGDAARATGDTHALARAALGFAGGDIGFGSDPGVDDPSTVVLLREGLDALGDGEPRLALRMTFRLCNALVVTEDEGALCALARRAQELDRRLSDVESEVLARLTGQFAALSRSPDPLRVFDLVGEFLELGERAERCGREDLLLRALEWSIFARYARGQMAECEQAIEHAAEIAERLGSPRFSWEIDANRAFRLMDLGDRAGAETLLHRAGATLRRLRPDLHVALELGGLLAIQWVYDGETATARRAMEAMQAAIPMGFMSALTTAFAAFDGDLETTRRRLASLLAEDLEELRRPDLFVPAALCMLALAATLSGDRAAGERLRPLFEPLRPYVVCPGLLIYFGNIAEWHIGRLEMLAGAFDAAVGELRAAVARADALELAWLRGWVRVDLALGLHRRGNPCDREEARAVLAEGEQIAERHAMRWVQKQAAIARAELDGRPQPAPAPASEHTRPLRALAARTGRRALAAMVRGQEDEGLERRFSDPRRQRALLRAAARGFQPARSGGFCGVIAYELEPYAIAPPPEAPWRWAIEVNSKAGHAWLVEPAPLEAAVTIHAGLAEWVRVSAGVQDAVTAMTVGRFRIEGDVIVAARLEAMFGAG